MFQHLAGLCSLPNKISVSIPEICQVTVHLELIQDQIKKWNEDLFFLLLLFPSKHTNPHTLLPRYLGS